MKTNICLLFVGVLFALMACQKDDTPETTYAFHNNTDDQVFDFTTYYIEGTNPVDVIKHGTFAGGATSKTTITNKDKIYFSMSPDPGGIVYLSGDNYLIQKETDNLFEITPVTQVFYPGGSTYFVQNLLAYEIYEVGTGFWNGSTFLDYLEHGNLSPWARTIHVPTSHTGITVSFTKAPGGEWFFADFQIEFNKINWLSLTDDVVFKK